MFSFAASLLAGTLSFAAEAQISGEVIHLADVADVSILPPELRKTAAALPLGRFAPSTGSTSISSDFLASQARARMPALSPWLNTINRDIKLYRAVPGGAPRVMAIAPTGIVKGDPVTVRIASGIFLIERQGVALADAQAGQHLFVRTRDRQVIRAICEEERP